MGGNYQKDLYKQLMEVMAKVDSLEAGQKQNHREIKSLTSEAASLRRENAALREEVSSLKKGNADLAEKCGKLEKENNLQKTGSPERPQRVRAVKSGGGRKNTEGPLRTRNRGDRDAGPALYHKVPFRPCR